MAMISIDNSVELMIKTYLNLPRRITGINLSKKKYEEINQKFPSLISILEKLAPEKIIGIELGEIEWFHRLRNNLYHEGNGITVEKEIVQMYSENAKTLFFNLFKLKVEDYMEKTPSSLIGEFLRLWVYLEQEIMRVYIDKTGSKNHITPFKAVDLLFEMNVLDTSFREEFHSIRQFRNKTIHELKPFHNEELNINILKLNKMLEIASEIG